MDTVDTHSITMAAIAALAACGLALAEGALPEPVREYVNCSADGSSWPYLLQLPEGEPQAILVYLHGHYADERQGMALGTYNDCFGKLRGECLRRQWVYACPYYGGNTWMNALSESGLADLIGALGARWPGRPVYLCGGSMGGTSALIFAVRRPELLAGVAALCPAGDIETYYAYVAASADAGLGNIAAAIRTHYQVDGRALGSELRDRSACQQAERLGMPVYISHGDADTVIPIEGARRLVARLRELGAPLRYKEIAGGAHDAPVNEVQWAEVLDFVSAEAGR